MNRRILVLLFLGLALILLPQSLVEASDPVVYASSLSGGVSQLWITSPSAGHDTLVGSIKTALGANLTITDVALARDGTLYGISFNTLYEINRFTGVAQPIGTGLGILDANALDVSPTGQLYMATVSGQLGTINTTTGVATIIGSYGSGFQSSGDILFGNDGRLYGSVMVQVTPIAHYLVTIDPATGHAIRVGTNDLGFTTVFGLFQSSDTLYGLTTTAQSCSQGAVVTINRTTGAAGFVRCIPFANSGATTGPTQNSFFIVPPNLKTLSDILKVRGAICREINCTLANGVLTKIGVLLSVSIWVADWTIFAKDMQQLEDAVDVFGKGSSQAQQAGNTLKVDLTNFLHDTPYFGFILQIFFPTPAFSY